VYAYGGHGVDTWWDRVQPAVQRTANLAVMRLSPASTRAAARLAQRTMALHCTIQDGQCWLGDAEDSVPVELSVLQAFR
jgi:uncharacterized protein YaeQ